MIGSPWPTFLAPFRRQSGLLNLLVVRFEKDEIFFCDYTLGGKASETTCFLSVCLRVN